MQHPSLETAALFEHIRQHLQQAVGICLQVQPGPVATEQQWRWEQASLRVVYQRTLSARLRPSPSAQSTLYVTEYVAPALAAQLRAAGLCYADAAGNAWLRYAHPPLVVLLQGFARRAILPEPVASPTRSVQMRFIFQLLTGPRLPGYSAPAVAAHTGFPPSTVGRLLHGLAQQGLWPADVPPALDKLRQLAQHWVGHYRTALRNRLNRQCYRWRDPAAAAGWAQLVLPPESWWSGETAARQLLGQATPVSSFTLYTRQPRPALAERLGLEPHSAGNVELLNPFFTEAPPTTACHQCVHPLLVYADLLLHEARHGQALTQQFRERFFDVMNNSLSQRR